MLCLSCKRSALQEPKDHLLKKKHSVKIINYSYIKLFQPMKRKNIDKYAINCSRTQNHQFSFHKYKNCIKNFQKNFFEKHIITKN